MHLLKGKIALVTGATGNIGQIIARRFLSEGATVILSGRSSDKLQALTEDLGREYPEFQSQNLKFIVMNLSSPEQIIEGKEKLESEVGALDILVNNAGSAGPKVALNQIPLTNTDLLELKKAGIVETETLEDSFHSLLTGPWVVTKHFCSLLRKSGSVINISTIFSKTEYFGRISYVLPKAALNALTQEFATEVGEDIRGIRINGIFPSAVASERINNVFAAMDSLKNVQQGQTAKDVKEWMSLKHPPTGVAFVTKEQVANAAVFLGSDLSTALNGQFLEVTNGLRYPEVKSQDIGQEFFNAPTALSELIVEIDLSSKKIVLHNLKKSGDEKNDLKIDLDNLENSVALVAEQIQSAIGNGRLNCMVSCSSVFLPKVNGIDDKTIVEFIKIGLVRLVVAGKFIEGLASNLNASSLNVYFTRLKENGPSDRILSSLCDEFFRAWKHENKIKNPSREFSISLVQFSRPEQLTQRIPKLFSLANSFSILSTLIDVLDSPSKKLGILRKVAVITGGSEGIGLKIAERCLREGYSVVLASRDEKKLNEATSVLVGKFPNSRSYIQTVSGFDAGVPDSWRTLLDVVYSHFGRIDVFVNNAGVAGGEEMVIDLPLSKWKETLRANFISNYGLMFDLLHRKSPTIEAILNVSSHFGGVKNASVPYPNRSDYAVSKSGQRALVESLHPIVGLKVALACVAPGPVAGKRLAGDANVSGLYGRRARKILENMRVNSIYRCFLQIARSGVPESEIFDFLCTNNVNHVGKDWSKKFIDILESERKLDHPNSSSAFLDKKMFLKLAIRLETKLGFKTEEYISKFTPPSEEVFSDQDLKRLALEIEHNMVQSLSMERFPTEEEVADAAMTFLRNRSLAGEVIHPSGGLVHQQKSSVGFIGLEGIAFSSLDCSKDRVLILGGVNLEFVERLIEKLVSCRAKEIVIASPTNDFEKLGSKKGAVFTFVKLRPNWDSEVPQLLAQHGSFDVIISLPMQTLQSLTELDENSVLPSTQKFEEIVHSHLTNHFLAARLGSYCEDARTILMSEALPAGSSAVAVAMSDLLRTCVRTLTMTASREATRLTGSPFFHLVDTTSSNYPEVCERMVQTVMYLIRSKEHQPSYQTRLKYYKLDSKIAKERYVNFPGMMIEI